MKKKFQYYMLCVSLFALAACDTTIENIGYQPPTREVDYEALRAYRASDHELIFGWFGSWNGGGSSASGSLRSLPDSMDMVSIWGGWSTPDERQKAEMKLVQQQRGLKVLACMFTPKVGSMFTPEGKTIDEHWGWDAADPDKQEAAVRKFADTLARFVLSLGYDGIDIDNEPVGGYGAIYGNVRLTVALIETLGKYMGPASGTGKMITIDGYLTTGMEPKLFKHVNYFISQAYYHVKFSDLDSRFTSYAKFWSGGVDPSGKMTEEEIYRTLARKFIVTEDFERYAGNGGQEWSLRPVDGVTLAKTRSSLGLAAWKPYYDGKPIQKGGAGLYHIENDYANTPEYLWTRQMIRIMNPSNEQ